MITLALLCKPKPLSRSRAALLPGVPPQNCRRWPTPLAHEEMEKENIAGLSLAIVVDKRIVVSRAYGLADVEDHAPASTATLFRTGSIAKPITAAAAMKLYQQGKLDLDAPVQTYCPAFPKKQWTTTTRELLGHLSGIRHYRSDDSDLFSTKHYAQPATFCSCFPAAASRLLS